jgi:hypothetical protein
MAEANDSAVQLAHYAHAAAGHLAAVADEALLAGRVAFPRPEAFAQI